MAGDSTHTEWTPVASSPAVIAKLEEFRQDGFRPVPSQGEFFYLKIADMDWPADAPSNWPLALAHDVFKRQTYISHLKSSAIQDQIFTASMDDLGDIIIVLGDLLPAHMKPGMPAAMGSETMSVVSAVSAPA